MENELQHLFCPVSKYSEVHTQTSQPSPPESEALAFWQLQQRWADCSGIKPTPVASCHRQVENQVRGSHLMAARWVHCHLMFWAAVVQKQWIYIRDGLCQFQNDFIGPALVTAKLENADCDILKQKRDKFARYWAGRALWWLEMPDDAVKHRRQGTRDAADLRSRRLTANDLESAQDQRVGSISSKSVRNTKKPASW